MKRPKKLYRYDINNKDLRRHVLSLECNPQVEMKEGQEWNQAGDLLRCRCCGYDFYGFATIKQAKKEAIQRTKEKIYEYEKWLKKLERA